MSTSRRTIVAKLRRTAKPESNDPRPLPDRREEFVEHLRMLKQECVKADINLFVEANFSIQDGKELVETIRLDTIDTRWTFKRTEDRRRMFPGSREPLPPPSPDTLVPQWDQFEFQGEANHIRSFASTAEDIIEC